MWRPDYPTNTEDQTFRRRFRNYSDNHPWLTTVYTACGVALLGAAAVVLDDRYKTPDLPKGFKNLDVKALNEFVTEWNELGTEPPIEET